MSLNLYHLLILTFILTFVNAKTGYEIEISTDDGYWQNKDVLYIFLRDKASVDKAIITQQEKCKKPISINDMLCRATDFINKEDIVFEVQGEFGKKIEIITKPLKQDFTLIFELIIDFINKFRKNGLAGIESPNALEGKDYHLIKNEKISYITLLNVQTNIDVPLIFFNCVMRPFIRDLSFIDKSFEINFDPKAIIGNHKEIDLKYEDNICEFIKEIKDVRVRSLAGLYLLTDEQYYFESTKKAKAFKEKDAAFMLPRVAFPQHTKDDIIIKLIKDIPKEFWDKLKGDVKNQDAINQILVNERKDGFLNVVLELRKQSGHNLYMLKMIKESVEKNDKSLIKSDDNFISNLKKIWLVSKQKLLSEK